MDDLILTALSEEGVSIFTFLVLLLGVIVRSFWSKLHFIKIVFKKDNPCSNLDESSSTELELTNSSEES